MLNDPASMAKTMPGVESFDVHDAEGWTANVKIPLGLGGLKMKIDMTKIEEREPELATLAIKGAGVGAMLNMQTSFDAHGRAGTVARDGVGGGREDRGAGRLDGPACDAPIVNQQVSHVLNALDKQIQERTARRCPRQAHRRSGTGRSCSSWTSANAGPAGAAAACSAHSCSESSSGMLGRLRVGASPSARLSGAMLTGGSSP